MIQTPRDLRELFKKYFPAALAATGPVLGLIAIGTLDPVWAPRPTGAAIATLTDVPPVQAAPPISAAQVAAHGYAAKVRPQPMSVSPFHHPVVDRPAPSSAKPAADTSPQPARPRAKTEFKLTAIVGGRQTIAVLNSKVRRVGDDAGQGWIVQSIDREAGVVTLRHAQDGTQQLSLKPAGAGQRR